VEINVQVIEDDAEADIDDVDDDDDDAEDEPVAAARH
jgi:hypothetical protein